MAWNMPFVTDRDSANGLEIAQAICIVGQRLRAFPIGPDGGLGTVKVGIFTDNIPCLRDIITPSRPEGSDRLVRKSVTLLVREELEKLSGIPNMRVELVLNWLKANSGGAGQKEASKLAEKCRKQGRNIFFVDEKERPSAEMDKSVAKKIADTLLPERLRIIKELRAKGLAPPRALTVLSMDDPSTREDSIASPTSSSMPPQAPNAENYEDDQERDNLSPVANEQRRMTNGDEQAGNDEAPENPVSGQELVNRQLNIEDSSTTSVFIGRGAFQTAALGAPRSGTRPEPNFTPPSWMI
ncbi:unnamed protein product [Sordaria macrospora k-hell]|uniref:WGS project CABT00000000 data, contig 2.18 n=1 Tax=Sordaria macrospora (strain ATCC MYA-333 / DSM 997 / K(L3346) / K-hell) TaxID=771870 RepID=F7W0R4_SORMK|nr:uncharacterized protein SMAC_02023 [Sordaria macrospora k-hell]CCC11366.1 unnamed protein product [Sordaria macrospora k-hell]